MRQRSCWIERRGYSNRIEDYLVEVENLKVLLTSIEISWFMCVDNHLVEQALDIMDKKLHIESI